MNNKKNTFILVGLLIVFAIIFFLSYSGLKSNEVLFDIGIPTLYENYLIMFLCIGSMIKIVYELYKE